MTPVITKKCQTMLEPLRKRERESARAHRVDISHLLMLPDEGE